MSQGCFVDEDEVDEFFDTREELSTLPDSFQVESAINLFDSDPLYQVWTRTSDSILQRRTLFTQMMGLDHVRGHPDAVDTDDCEVMVNDSITVDFNRSYSEYGAVLRGSEGKDGSLMPCCSNVIPSSNEHRSPTVQFEHKIKNFDNDRTLVPEEFRQISTTRSIQEVHSSEMVTIDGLQRSFEPSSSCHQLTRRDDNSSNIRKTRRRIEPSSPGHQLTQRDDNSSNNKKTPRRRMVGWLRRLGTGACIGGKQDHAFQSGVSDSDQTRGTRSRVRAYPYRKQIQELSALYMGQNFMAHHGAILTMKFSPDGEYLASGGEDGVVRVWKVMECPRSIDDIPVDDPSCSYFNLNQNSELSPLYVDKMETIISKGLRRTSDSVCVVIPQELFQINEKPFCEFHGHNGDVLDLAWSKDKGLLSSSTDKTVRLWKLGWDRCIKVFPHNNYVTCIQFNPVDERYFISGSIDGKARVWEIAASRVVDWVDVRQIITAVCYRLDGEVLVVGSIMGDCRFYDLSDNHLQLDAEISFQGRKKSVGKRITGFQFCPGNPLKLMVTSADSTVRILDGIDVISKYKGLRNSGSRISANFTSDGSHIVSASEDSNVYIWNHSNHDHILLSDNVKNTWSSEHFSSSLVSIAIPWQDFSSRNMKLGGSRSTATACFSPSSSFTHWSHLLSDIAPKGSATWPEENLPSSIPSGLGKSQVKFLKTSFRMNASHARGQVIVTAGNDGTIRSFQNYGLPVHL